MSDLGAERREVPWAEALGPVLTVGLQAPGWAAGPEEVRAAKVNNHGDDNNNDVPTVAVLLCVNEPTWLPGSRTPPSPSHPGRDTGHSCVGTCWFRVKNRSLHPRDRPRVLSSPWACRMRPSNCGCEVDVLVDGPSAPKGRWAQQTDSTFWHMTKMQPFTY